MILECSAFMRCAFFMTAKTPSTQRKILNHHRVYKGHREKINTGKVGLFRPLEIGVKTDARMSDQKEFLSEGLVMDL